MCVAVCCSVLQCVAVFCRKEVATLDSASSGVGKEVNMCVCVWQRDRASEIERKRQEERARVHARFSPIYDSESLICSHT